MSALAHLIESRGVPTTVIGLVRPHMEATKPPRGLWTPFPLGRPLGAPEDSGFQRRVLLAALGLLERTDGPVILEDFPEDPPGAGDLTGWVPPDLPAASPDSAAAWEAALSAEIAALRPLWERARARFGRTTVGLSTLPPEAWPGYAAPFLEGGAPAGDPPRGSAALTLRYVADDLKAMYLEAAQAEGPAPSSRQLAGWLFQGTVAGRMLVALRAVAAASEAKGLQTVARFLVPVPNLPPGA